MPKRQRQKEKSQSCADSFHRKFVQTNELRKKMTFLFSFRQGKGNFGESSGLFSSHFFLRLEKNIPVFLENQVKSKIGWLDQNSFLGQETSCPEGLLWVGSSLSPKTGSLSYFEQGHPGSLSAEADVESKDREINRSSGAILRQTYSVISNNSVVMMFPGCRKHTADEASREQASHRAT